MECKVDPNTSLEVRTGFVLATTTLTINVLPDQHPKIDSIELTQGIQELQHLADLESDLSAAGEPLVPVIGNKPAVLRVYMQKFNQIDPIRIDISGPSTQTKSMTLQPQCVPQTQRRRTNGCQSVDFYFAPPIGPFPTTVTLFDINGNTLESHTLSFQSRKAGKLVLKAVSVCDSKDAHGTWVCAPANTLTGEIATAAKLLPTNDVEVQVTGAVVKQDLAAFQGPNAEISWFQAVVQDVDHLFGKFDITDYLPGFHNTYFGVVRPTPNALVGGITYNIPSRAAAARTSAIRLGIETVNDVVAHEIGHSLGGHHTNTNNPAAANAPPGCYSQAVDPATDWPFPGDNRIQSTTQLEVGFDVGQKQPVIPDSTFDIMSYCIPRWISPFHYRQFMSALGATSTAPPPVPTPVLSATEFLTVSGTITNDSIQFDPVFELETTAPVDNGTGIGNYQINVLDSSGTLLFTRFFTPANSSSETAGPDIQGPPTFSELIPVIAGAAQITVMDPTGTQLGTLTPGGTSPAVQIIAPAPGAILSGMQTISWTATNPNNGILTAKVLYSPNNGTRWMQLDQVTGANSASIDFDMVPGSVGTALVRVLVSDGINTGSATSAPFNVAKKTDVTAEILTPQMNSIFQKGDLVMCTASAYNVDNGVLDGSSITWSSDLDGAIGNGATLPVYNLQPGTHQITMTATDQDNNTATRNVTIRVADSHPEMTVAVKSLDGPPTTCVQVTLQAMPDSVELAKIDYSLDNGATFTEVPLTSNPYTFIVPGSGSFQLLARAFDAADQVAVGASGFTTSALCSLLPQITRVAPSSGTVGSSVQIVGSGFGTTQGTSTVKFNGTTATTVGPWSDTSITAVVPTGSTTGNVVVTTGAGPSNGVGFTVSVPPSITGFESDQGAPTVGAPLIILGTSFGATQGSSTVVIGGITAAPTSWSDTSVAINVPSGLPVGYFDVTVNVNGMTSNARTFYLVPGINSIFPTFGPVGTSVTISGTSFGATQGSSTIDFCGGQPTSWSDTAIVVPVVDSTGSCTPTVTLYTSGGPNNSWGGSNQSLYFDLSPPVITSLSPQNGQVGSWLNINGSNFGVAQGAVTINGLSATIESWTVSGVAVSVPSGATSGNVVVTSSHGVSSNAVPFTVTSPDGWAFSPASSTTPGLLQLASFVGFGTTTLPSQDLVNQPVGDYLIQAFDTQAGDPGTAVTWPAGLPAGFTVTLQQVAGTPGTLFPEVQLFLNNASGTPVCSAIGANAITATQAQYYLTCSPASDIVVTAADRYYLWVGLNSTQIASTSVQAQLLVGRTGTRLNSTILGALSVPVH